MLKKLRIQNFKGWEDTGVIDMAPITLFFGSNSSGKSSIGQFLMMLKQTAASQDRKVVFYPGDSNSAIQLGTYQDMVFRRDKTKKIIFEYTWSLPERERPEFKDPAITNRPGPRPRLKVDCLQFQAKIELNKKNLHAPVVEHLQYDLMSGEESVLSIGMRRQGAKTEYQIEGQPRKLVRNQGRGWPLGAPVRFYGFPDEVVAYYQNADFVQELNLQHEKLFRSLFYLGPLREKAERLYTWPGTQPESVGNAGKYTVPAILASRNQNRKMNLGYRKPIRSFDEIIASKLQDMGLIEDFTVKAISDQRREYEVKVRAKGSRDMVDLPDVGFGVSQVLPVLVECFYAPSGSIIVMEQPEIHLHPSAQSALADVMIDVINSRESSENRNIQLIIETHSEHFLRRLQRRIAEDKLAQDKLAVYFADITQSPARLEPLEIDMFGNIRNWPKDFFGDDMGDILAQADAAATKRKKQAETAK